MTPTIRSRRAILDRLAKNNAQRAQAADLPTTRPIHPLDRLLADLLEAPAAETRIPEKVPAQQ